MFESYYNAVCNLLLGRMLPHSVLLLLLLLLLLAGTRPLDGMMLQNPTLSAKP